jgi:hypothetical protein
MPRFLIEVSHPPEVGACARAIQLMYQTGSHFITNADFGCMDGDHRAWIIVDVDSKDEARQMLPPVYRTDARIVGLNKFSLEQVAALLKQHGFD